MARTYGGVTERSPSDRRGHLHRVGYLRLPRARRRGGRWTRRSRRCSTSRSTSRPRRSGAAGWEFPLAAVGLDRRTERREDRGYRGRSAVAVPAPGVRPLISDRESERPDDGRRSRRTETACGVATGQRPTSRHRPATTAEPAWTDVRVASPRGGLASRLSRTRRYRHAEAMSLCRACWSRDERLGDSQVGSDRRPGQEVW